MKKFCTFLLFFLALGAYAQPVLYGLEFQPDTSWAGQGIPPGDWEFQAVDPTTNNQFTLDTIDNLNSVLVNSSTFDQTGKRYLFQGIDNSGNANLYVVDANTGLLDTTHQIPAFPNELNYDMGQGRLFGLSNNRLVELKIDSGLVVPVAQIPANLGIVLGASAVSSNSGAFYFLGVEQGTSYLYRVDTRAGSVTRSGAVSTNYIELQYDNVNDRLLGLWYDRLNQEQHIVEVDTATGQSQSVMQIASGQFWIKIASSDFDQLTGTYLFLGGAQRVDTIFYVQPDSQSVFQTQFDNRMIELEIDNSTFASRYAQPSGGGGLIQDIVMFEVKVTTALSTSDELTIEMVLNRGGTRGGRVGRPGRPFTVTLYDISGRTLYNKQWRPQNRIERTRLPIGSLSKGMYFVRVSNGIQRETIRWYRF